MDITITPAVANIGEEITVTLPSGCSCRVQCMLQKEYLTDGTYEDQAVIRLQPGIWLPKLPGCGDTRLLSDIQAPWILVDVYDQTGQYARTLQKRFDVVVGSQFAPELNWLLSPKNDLSQVLEEDYKNTYFQGLSQVQALTEVRCWGGAQVAKISMQVEGKTYEGVTQTLLSQPLSTMGQVAVKLTATDTRGLSTSYTEIISVTPYARPVVILGEKGVFRCDAQGVADPGGTYLYVQAGASVFPLSAQSRGSVRCRVTLLGQTPGEFLSTPIADGIVPGVQLLPEYNYLVELMADDGVCQGNILSVTVANQRVYAHQKDASLALGMYSEQGGLEVAWPARFYDTLTLGSATLTEEKLQKLLKLIT